MKKAPSLPFFISVEDYHQFSNVQETLRLLNPKVKVEEIEAFDSGGELMFGVYVGLVYEGRKPSRAQILEQLTKKSTRIHDLRP